uniref:Uncharacterized protein n=1 Tax=Vespula pensylvanica TaxID=30213 RepID=A0A834JVQ9_VESPE|nr:hypothetical protein H0235_017415 [Vespula pensylvanica]
MQYNYDQCPYSLTALLINAVAFCNNIVVKNFERTLLERTSIVEIRNDKKSLREINDDSKKENLLIRAVVVVEEEKKEENEKEKEEEEEEEEKEGEEEED